MNQPENDWESLLDQDIGALREHLSEVLGENNRLRQQLALSREELSRATGDEAVLEGMTESELATAVKERDRLESEIMTIQQQLDAIKKENSEFAERYVQVEKESSNLASLYVASYQLHSSLEYDIVLQRICEILINLIGAEHFAIYVYDARSNALTLVGGEGIQEERGQKIPLSDNFLARIARSGELYLAKDASQSGDNEHPIAALPLVASDELLGLLVVYKLLMQKDAFEAIDLELFDLLAGHAATAVRAAQLYARSQRKASTLEGLLQILKESSSQAESGNES